MSYYPERDPLQAFGELLLLLFAVVAFLFLTACATDPKPLPTQAPPAIEVKVPVPVPCEVEKVQETTLPSAIAAVPGDIWEGVKLVLADREILKADKAKLQAANNSPCPAK